MSKKSSQTIIACRSTEWANQTSSSGITVLTYLSQNSTSPAGTPLIQKSEARYSTRLTLVSSMVISPAISLVMDLQVSQSTSLNPLNGIGQNPKSRAQS